MNPQRNPQRPQQQLSAEQVQKQREYLMQQQKLRLMATSNTQKVVSADTLIENLLGRKETFKPSDPLPLSKFAAESPEQVVEVAKFQQTQFDSRQPANQQVVAVEWLSPKSVNFPEIYRKVFSLVGDPDGMVDTGKIFPILLTSGLHTDVLGYIWGLVNRCVAGKLTENELYAVLALVALAQKGYSFNSANVLGLVQQAPIPNLNLGTEPQIPIQMRREDLNLQSSTSSHNQSQINMAASLIHEANTRFDQPTVSAAQLNIFDTPPTTAEVPNNDDFDDFTEFQSASASVSKLSLPMKTSVPIQKRVPIAQKEPTKVPAAAKTQLPLSVPSSLLADPTSFPEPVFVQKFPVVNAVTGGRSIGSRLANHSLGTSKSSKPRHHKHHHHHRVSPPQQPPSLGEDDFSDFQTAVASDDPFSKCPTNQQKVPTEIDLRHSVVASPKHLSTKSKLAKDVVKPIEIVEVLKVPDSPSKVETADKASELMGVEDRYGALRALSLFEVEPSVTEADDFGGIFSTDTTVVDDSFADIASRVNPVVTDAEISWSSPKVDVTTPVQFDVDDWGTFESASELNTNLGSSSESKSAGNFDFWQKELAVVDNLSSQIADLNFDVVSPFSTLAGNEFPAALSVDASVNPMDTGIVTLNTQLSSSRESPHTNDEDDFGDFISPNTWINESKSQDIQLDVASWQEDGKEVEPQSLGSLWQGDSKPAAEPSWLEEAKSQQGKVMKEKVLDNPLVSNLWLEDSKGMDNLSVSSLELPGLEHAWDAVGEWRRCLQSCLTILQFAVDTFDALPETTVLLEVLNSTEGQNYLKDLVEVWYICDRIATSYHKTGLDQKIDALLNSTTTMWSLLKPYYRQAKLSIESDMSAEGPDMCSVCLADGATVDFEGHSYHAPCANLWLNNIDTVLPALHQP